MGFLLGFITDEATQDMREAAALALRLGFGALEIRTARGVNVDAMSAQTLNEYRRVADDNNLVFTAAASALFKCEYEKRALGAEFDRLERLMDAADILGLDIIRAFPFIRGNCGFKEALNFIAEAGSEAARRAGARGKKLAFEADPSVYATNHALLRDVLDAIGSPFAGAIYDPGNCVYDPLGETPYPDGYERVKGLILNVHVKDAKRISGEPECVMVGTGEVDYAGIIKRLRADGYTGALSLETHYRKRRALDGAQLKRPGGYEFTEGGMEATTESALALKKLLYV